MFDIVIPLGPNERKNIHHQIVYTKKNVIGYRNIYIITNIEYDLKIDGCIIVDEKTFPFKMEDMATCFAQQKNDRNGWYLQQLLKLYAGCVIDGICENYLVIDADVFFLKPTSFIEDGKFIFTLGNEYHLPYFEHMLTLSPTFVKEPPTISDAGHHSGIAHHMMFNAKIVKEIFTMVEKLHDNGPFWKIFINSVVANKTKPIHPSGASEYEIYFNYMVKNYRNNIIIRKLCWENVSKHTDITQVNTNFDYVSICYYR